MGGRTAKRVIAVSGCGVQLEKKENGLGAMKKRGEDVVAVGYQGGQLPEERLFEPPEGGYESHTQLQEASPADQGEKREGWRVAPPGENQRTFGRNRFPFDRFNQWGVGAPRKGGEKGECPFPASR